MKFQCQYCLKELSNKSSLNNHLSNAKYCILKRNVDNDTNVKVFKCFDCNKSFTSKQTLNLHQLKCIEKLKQQHLQEILEIKNKHNEEIIQKDLHIKDLEAKLENIALKAVSKPTTINNNNSRINQINNLSPITTEQIKENIQYLTLDHIKEGAVGYAKYALDYPFKDKIICVDYARRKVKYKDEEGNLVDDPEMSKLCVKFFSAIEDHNNKLIRNHSDVIIDKITNINNEDVILEDEEEHYNNMNDIYHNELMQLFNTGANVRAIKTGKKPEMLNDFVKDICSKTTC
jgi:hypothetical protein